MSDLMMEEYCVRVGVFGLRIPTRSGRSDFCYSFENRTDIAASYLCLLLPRILQTDRRHMALHSLPTNKTAKILFQAFPIHNIRLHRLSIVYLSIFCLSPANEIEARV